MIKKADFNEKKYQEYKKNKITKWIIIILSILVIILEILALFNVISMFWGIGIFVILYLLKNFFLK